jgi:hypothetical protein
MVNMQKKSFFFLNELILYFTFSNDVENQNNFMLDLKFS